MDVPLIQARQLSKVYRLGSVEVHALREVDLDLEEGAYLAIMGASGSGKSTLMQLLGCLARPSSGNLFLEGQDLSLLDDSRLAEVRNRSIGFVFQSFNLLPRYNAIENVALPLMYAGVPRAARLDRAKVALASVGLGPRSNHRPGELSGGEQQRVAIARALVINPKVVLADEPTGALDSESGSAILDLFETLHEQGRTLIVVTHDPEVGQRARRIIRLRDGHIQSDSGSSPVT